MLLSLYLKGNKNANTVNTKKDEGVSGQGVRPNCYVEKRVAFLGR